MPAYCLFDNLTMHAPARVAEGKERTAPVVAQYGGRYLVIGGRVDLVEGLWRPTFPVLLELVLVRTILSSVMSLATEIRQRKPFESREHEAYLNLLRTGILFMRRETELLKSHDLTPAQFNVLRILRGAGADGLICREVAQRMLTYDPDLTKLLDRLEARGLATRERQPTDRRAIVARITPEGLRMLEKVDKPMLDMVTGLLGHMGEKKLKTLSVLLEGAREGVR